ncbi:MAG: gliding motility-associated C-terminal domain-containing protein, partial [Sphingobacteriales bacterium]
AVYHTPSLVSGCDSATTLNLSLNPVITATKTIIICPNMLPYTWNNMTLTAGGNAVAVYHTPSTVTGCDSATTLNLTVNPSITATKNFTICANQLPYVWNGITVPAGGTAVAVYHTPSVLNGCDSATTMNLTVNPIITVTKNITICNNQLPYVWNGFTLNTGGTAVAVYHMPSAVTGCDSATTLNLLVNPVITATKNITICANQLPYVWNGFTLNAGGNAVAVYHTPSAVTGCDSATTLNLNVNPLITATKNNTICANQLPYVWNGFTVNAGGIAVAVYHTPSTATGCDSATTLNLTVNPLITATKTIAICPNQLPYLWNNISLSSGGNGVAIYHTPSAVTGCDSATSLNLIVNPLISTTKTVTICPNQLPYVWNGITINAGGNAVAVYHTPSTVTGCDSATTLNLIVNPVISITKNQTICSGQLPYTWNGFVLNTGGNAVAVYHTPSLVTGCDSATTLNLAVLPSYNATTALTICHEDAPFIFGTQLLLASGTYTHVFTATSGCDSTVTLHLTVRPAATSASATMAGCGSLLLAGNTYSVSTTLHDTLTNAAGCDSLYRTRNIIIYPNTATTETLDTGSCKPISIGGVVYNVSTTLTDTLHTAMGCDSVIRIIHVYIEPLELSLSASPAEVFEGKPVLLETSANMAYEIDGWLPASWFPALHAREQQWIATQDATISVWGRSDHGCLDTATVHIDVVTMNHALFVPNAFSPNGDGNNDVFRPSFYINLGHQYNSFRVFNRFGQKVYEASMIEEAGWDGLYRGQPADLGTYNYIIEVAFEDGYKRVL